MHVHEEVLAAANTVVSRLGGNGVFTVPDILPLLKHLNESTVRTHVVSRCCVNAPKNHPHKWGYFRRVGFGKYEIMPQYRKKAAKRVEAVAAGKNAVDAGGRQRSTIHVIVTQSAGVFTGECVEVSVVTQGQTFDELLRNLGDALSLHLEGEDLASFGLSENPKVQILYEVPLAV